MSLKYRNGEGVETPLAGLNGTSGELIPSVSYYQSGVTETFPMPAGSSANHTIQLSEEMPDTDYVVVVNASNPYDVLAVTGKTVDSIGIWIYNTDSSAASSTTVSWQAFKLMTQEQIALDEQAITDIQEVIPSTATTANKLVTQSELTAAISDAINNLSALIYG